MKEKIDNNYIDLNKENFKIFLTTNYDRFIEDHVSGINRFNSLIEYTSSVQRLFANTNENIYSIFMEVCLILVRLLYQRKNIKAIL